MRSYKTEGIIIKRRNFGESDRILMLLTKNCGKIQVRTPGVRKISSRRSSHIELLNLTLFTLYKNPSLGLPIVTEAQAVEEFLPLKNNLVKIGLAYYVCELIDALCGESQENRRVFFLARDTLFRLTDLKVNTVRESFSRHSDLARISLSDGDSGCAALTRMTDSERGLSIVSNFEDELLVALGFLSRQHKLIDKRAFIENILEKKLKTIRLFPLFLGNSER